MPCGRGEGGPAGCKRPTRDSHQSLTSEVFVEAGICRSGGTIAVGQVIFLHGVWVVLNCLVICFPIYKTASPSLPFWSFFVRVFAFQIKFPKINDTADRAIILAKKIFSYVIVLHIIMLTISRLFFLN